MNKSAFEITSDFLEKLAKSEDPGHELCWSGMHPIQAEEIEGVLVWAKMIQEKMDKAPKAKVVIGGSDY